MRLRISPRVGAALCGAAAATAMCVLLAPMPAAVVRALPTIPSLEPRAAFAGTTFLLEYGIQALTRVLTWCAGCACVVVIAFGVGDTTEKVAWRFMTGGKG